MSSPNEPDEARAAGPEGKASSPASGSWVAEAAASVNRSAESGEAPPWQRAATRNAAARPGQTAPRAEGAGRPTEVIRTVDSGEDPPGPGGRAPESAGQTATTRVAEPAPRPESRPTATPAPSQPTTAAPAPGVPAVQPGVPTADSKVSRYVTGTAAPRALQQMKGSEPEPARAEVARQNDTKGVGSELPDLSAGPARPAQRSETDSSLRSRIQVGARAKGGPIRASMQIRRVDPWSALKVSLLLSVALFFVWMIAVAFLYLVLGGMGVWTKLNSNVGDLLTASSGAGGELVSAGSIFGGALLIGLVNIVLLTAMATIGAFIYNLATDIVGGVEVTLADRD